MYGNHYEHALETIVIKNMMVGVLSPDYRLLENRYEKAKPVDQNAMVRIRDIHTYNYY